MTNLVSQLHNFPLTKGEHYMRARLSLVLLSSAGIVLVAVGASSASASSITISGTDLSGLKYAGDPGDAQYVPAAGATPALAALYTPDSGVSGDDPGVFVKAANAGLSTLGTLNA